MPKVKITSKRGLEVVPGGGLDVRVPTELNGTTTMNGATMVGHRKRVVTISSGDYGGANARYELSGSDSDSIFILGDPPAGNGILTLPTKFTAGWNATFVATAAFTSGRTVTLTGSQGSGNGNGDTTFVGNVYERGTPGTSESVTIAATAGVVFNAGGGTLLAAGDRVTVEVVGTTAGDILVQGSVAQ